MNIASALIKQILALQDYETWTALRKNYLPPEYHSLFSVIDKHCSNFHSLPTFEDLKFEIRDAGTKEKLFLIEAIEIDVDAYKLLEYLKNEYTQREALEQIEDFIDTSIAFESAEETVSHLHQIVLDIESKVDLKPPQETMQKMPLFATEEELARYIGLGLNADYDEEIKFKPTDLILIGGKRGAGKSVVCANIINNIYERGKIGVYFTIEMTAQETMQRICAIATGVSFNKIKYRNLSITDYEKIAMWWCSRYKDSNEFYIDYLIHRDFAKLHTTLTGNRPLIKEKQIHIVYDPMLTIAKMTAEVEKIKVEGELGGIAVDYINQLRRSLVYSGRSGQYDWTEQIEVSKALKQMAQEYEVPVISPYQIDTTGEARFAKGILDACDAAYTINPFSKEDNCLELVNVKMRNDKEIGFISKINWESLKIGPESAEAPKEKKDEDLETGESSQDLTPF